MGAVKVRERGCVLLEVNGTEVDRTAGGETLGEGGGTEEGEQYKQKAGTHCRERDSVLAQESFAQ